MSATLTLFPASSSASAAFDGHVLVVPAVSIGSVPQLSADLLVHHRQLGLRCIGAFDSAEWCLPYACPPDQVLEVESVAPGAQQIASVGLPLQLYSNASARLTVLQQRSPILKSAKHEFVLALAKWAKSSGFESILVLSSLDAALRVDAEMHIPLVRLLATPSSSSAPLLNLLAQSFPAFQPSQTQLQLESSRASEGRLPHLPSAGATRLLLQAAAHENLPAGALLMFASEGDNRGDAHAMATMVLDLLRRTQDQSQGTAQQHFERDGAFNEPRSWLTVFGQRMDQAIYG